MAVESAFAPGLSAPHSFIDRLGARLKKPAIITGARLVGAGLTFALQIILARTLSAEHLGVYFTALSLVTVLAAMAALGYPSAMVRFVSRYTVKKREAWVGGFVRAAYRDATALSVIVMLLTVACLSAFQVQEVFVWSVAFLLPLIPALALMRITGARAISAEKSLIGFLPDTIGRPFIVCVCVIALLGMGNRVELLEIVLISMAAGVFVCAAQIAMLTRSGTLHPFRILEDGGERNSKLRHRWRRMSAPLIIPTLFASLLIDVVLIWSALFVDAAEIAVFAITIKLAFLAGFANQVLVQLDMPKISRAYFSQDTERFRKLLMRSLALSACIAMGAMGFFAIAGSHLLSMFGEDYANEIAVLLICSVAVLARIPGLYAIQILTIAGKQTLINCALPPVLMVGLTMIVALGTFFGATGIAIAVCGILIIHSAVFSILARRWI